MSADIAQYNSLKYLSVEVNPGMASGSTYSAKGFHNAFVDGKFSGSMILFNPQVFSGMQERYQLNRTAHEFRHTFHENDLLLKTNSGNSLTGKWEIDAQDYARMLFPYQ